MCDFDDAIGDMTSDLLTEAGRSCVYVRGNTTTTITLRKSVQQSEVVEVGTGALIEVLMIDFIGLTTAMPYDPPERGDLIITGGERFEVQPNPTTEKVYRRISPQMTRIHTRQIG